MPNHVLFILRVLLTNQMKPFISVLIVICLTDLLGQSVVHAPQIAKASVAAADRKKVTTKKKRISQENE